MGRSQKGQLSLFLPLQTGSPQICQEFGIFRGAFSFSGFGFIHCLKRFCFCFSGQHTQCFPLATVSDMEALRKFLQLGPESLQIPSLIDSLGEQMDLMCSDYCLLFLSVTLRYGYSPPLPKYGLCVSVRENVHSQEFETPMSEVPLGQKSWQCATYGPGRDRSLLLYAQMQSWVIKGPQFLPCKKIIKRVRTDALHRGSQPLLSLVPHLRESKISPGSGLFRH